MENPNVLKSCNGSNPNIEQKIVPLIDAAVRSMTWKAQGRTVVVTNGCFDLLHVGHVKMLENAKTLGSKLIVGVNSDRAVKLLKGKGRPINKEKDRARVIAALQSVDLVVMVDDVRVGDFLEVVRPSVWAKGGDYTLKTLDKGEVKVANRLKAKIALIPPVNGVSTTNVIKRATTKA